MKPGKDEMMSKWQPIETAPKDGTFFLAKLANITDDRYHHWSGRQFVVRYVGAMDWGLFPGMGVGDDWLEGWMPLPDPSPAQGDGQ